MREFGIRVVPLRFTIGDHEYVDGDVTLHEVMDRVDEGVTTSAPSPGDFTIAIDACPPDDDVVVLTIASTMSATGAAATLAARAYSDRAVVVDTGTASGGQGLVVLAAAEAARAGGDRDAVVAAAQRAAGDVHLVATVGDLDRLAKSGRVPGVAAMAGRWLGLNPLFEFRGGHAHPLLPARGRPAAIERMLGVCRRSAPPGGGRLHVAALHALAEEPAQQLLEAVVAEHAPATAFIAPFSAVMVVHTGPDLAGLAWRWA